MNVAYIGLGSNLGERQDTLQRALADIGKVPGSRLLAASPFYRSSPVEATGPDYINAVAQIETPLAPAALLAALQAIELAHGRQRPYRNAPRTLDLDLLLYDTISVQTPTLTVPHPRMHQRAFVLRPLSDLAPDLLLHGKPLQHWLTRCQDQSIWLYSENNA